MMRSTLCSGSPVCSALPVRNSTLLMVGACLSCSLLGSVAVTRVNRLARAAATCPEPATLPAAELSMGRALQALLALCQLEHFFNAERPADESADLLPGPEHDPAAVVLPTAALCHRHGLDNLACMASSQ